MADHIDFAVSATPIEELADEQSNTVRVISGEVGQSLGSGGSSVDLSAYNGSGANQGFTGGAVVYKSISHSAGGTAISATNLPDFVYVENTGYKYSSATVLGAVTTDCISVVIKVDAYSNGVSSGFMDDTGDAGQDHYFEVAWLKPGQGVVLPCGSGITQFGSNAGDLSRMNDTANTSGITTLYARTFTSAGSAASSANAIKFLVVT